MPDHIENLIVLTLIPLFLVLLGAACLIWAEILGSMLKPRGARPLPDRRPEPYPRIYRAGYDRDHSRPAPPPNPHRDRNPFAQPPGER